MLLSNVLLVDDDPDIRMLVSLSLERLGGLHVRAEQSGPDALEALRSGYQPDMVLLDVMMPGMDGVQTLSEIRRLPALQALPVCFLTAKAQPHELQRLQDLKVSAVLTKPFSPQQLVEQVKASWARAVDAPAGAPHSS